MTMTDDENLGNQVMCAITNQSIESIAVGYPFAWGDALHSVYYSVSCRAIKYAFGPRARGLMRRLSVSVVPYLGPV